MKKLRKNKITIVLGFLATLGFNSVSFASDNMQVSNDSELTVINKNNFITDVDFLFEKNNTGVITLGSRSPFSKNQNKQL